MDSCSISTVPWPCALGLAFSSKFHAVVLGRGWQPHWGQRSHLWVGRISFHQWCDPKQQIVVACEFGCGLPLRGHRLVDAAIDDHVSWEGHLSGAVVGTLLTGNEDRDRKILFTILNVKTPTPLPEWWMAAHPNHPDTKAQRASEADGGKRSTGTPPPVFTSPTSTDG